MSLLTVRKPIACVLIVLLAIISGVGEGLHWIPGCGHGVLVGNGVLFLGISAPDFPQPVDGCPRVERPQDRDVPIYDEDQCSICSVVGQICMSGGSVQVVLFVPLIEELPAVVLCDAPAAIPLPLRARAPPLV
ncbi:MAG: hypothetical protein JW888_11200 [Pirellulales bacterium]|nr:hypothetical protein [Pirellulales bacterium]